MSQIARVFSALLIIGGLFASLSWGQTQGRVRVPADQRALTDVLSKFNERAGDAPNDIQREKVDAEFGRAFCAKRPKGDVSGWVGTIESIDDNNPSKGISLHLGINTQNLYSGPFGVGLWVNNDYGIYGDAYAHNGPPQLIPVGSPLYNAVSTLREGDTVAFSGTVLQYSTEEACYKDSTVTSLIIRFSSVKKLGHDIGF